MTSQTATHPSISLCPSPPVTSCTFVQRASTPHVFTSISLKRNERFSLVGEAGLFAYGYSELALGVVRGYSGAVNLGLRLIVYGRLNGMRSVAEQ